MTLLKKPQGQFGDRYEICQDFETNPDTVTYRDTPSDPISEELTRLRQRVEELEAIEARHQRIEEELRARAYQQAMLSKLGQYVLEGVEIDTLLDEITTLVTLTLKVKYCQILKLIPDQDALRLRAGTSWPTLFVNETLVEAKPDSFLGYTLFSSEPVIIKNLQTDTRFTDTSQPYAQGIVSGLSVIIDGEAWPFGVLTVNTAEKRHFTQHDIHFLQAVANILATAIEHRHTQEALHEAHSKLELRVKERTTDLQTANEEIKTFAYIISHDLRAPLVNIKGFSGELAYSLDTIRAVLDQVLPQLDPSQRQAIDAAIHEDIPEALDFINSSVSRMNNQINAILKLSRLGRRELSFETLDVDCIVQAALETLAHQIEHDQIKVKVGPLPKVAADRTSLEQIMDNLLSNAVNYLDPKRPGVIEIKGERKQNETRFQVIDNGRGIAAEDMHKVFELFRRAGKQDVPGEGMGLSYVRTLVRRHGGHISCASELGVGTTFTFTISNNWYQQEEGGIIV